MSTIQSLTRPLFGQLTRPRFGSLFQKIEEKANAVNSKNYIFLLSLFTIAFLLYVNTLANGFARDDIEVFYQNAFVVKGVHGIPEILSTPHLYGYSHLPNETYRPLSLVLFSVMHQFFGASPVVGHLGNIIAFCICVMLLFLFLDKLFDRKKTLVAFVAALLFAAHPVHTEVVANIKSMDSLLCFLFAFLSLNIFMKYYERGQTKHLISGMIALFLSFISKETVISFVLIVPLIFFLYKNGEKRRALFISIATWLPALVFVLLRAYILKIHNNDSVELNVMENALVNAPDTSSKIATSVVVMGYYLKLLLIPYPLICDYSLNSIPYAHFTDAGVQLSLAVYGFLVVTAVYRLIKFKNDPWAFGILFFLATIALFSNIVFLLASEMSERFTFFPSVGYTLVAALVLERYTFSSSSEAKGLLNVKTCIILLPLLLFFSSVTIARNTEWADNYTLFKSDVDKLPQNSHLNYCMGDVLIDSLYQDEKDPAAKKEIVKQSISYLRKAIDIEPDYRAAQTAIAYAYYLNGEIDSAERHDKIALNIEPGNVSVINSLTAIYFQNGRYNDALTMALRSIAADPDFVLGYNAAGLCYANMRQFDSGIMYLNKAISVDPDYDQTYKNLSLVYTTLGKTDSAKKYDAIYNAKNNVIIDL